MLKSNRLIGYSGTSLISISAVKVARSQSNGYERVILDSISHVNESFDSIRGYAFVKDTRIHFS